MKDKYEELAHGISAVTTRQVANDAVLMTFTDTRSVETSFLVNAETLNAILTPLLGLAIAWADDPAIEIAQLVGPTSAMPATQIAIGKGRDENESVLRVFVGKVEVTFLMPLAKLLQSLANLRENIEPHATPRKRH